MLDILKVPVESVIALTPERLVMLFRAILQSECSYAKIGHDAITISNKLTTPDGGIDSQVKTPENVIVPVDCIFKCGLTGFQLKSGTSFKPWTESAIRSELLGKTGRLLSEVERIMLNNGIYIMICTGYDLTPEQRNKSIDQIAKILAEFGYDEREKSINVFGASQVTEYAERYPGTASMLTLDPIQEALVVEEWQHEAHMSNEFKASTEQGELIEKIRLGLLGNAKHLRILGEPGLGKTRIVLEAVKDERILPYVLYIEHGEQFGQTKLFRQLLKYGREKPLVLVIDELAESALIDIWNHLKLRCGELKLITMDHGRDECYDNDIEKLVAPRLSDEKIKEIIESCIGKARGIDRWVALCEGSPRVAMAVANNLRANPRDILKPPSTISLWSRFLHGYDKRDEEIVSQVDCVAQHLALFNRFGYEHPVDAEAVYIFDMIKEMYPTIGWARFQEIVKSLRERRVLQGSKTLFFVPKALHIYLWKNFWLNYGRSFDFNKTIDGMPSSLHFWFMGMFKYADNRETEHVVDDILRPDGFYSQHESITSGKGAIFLSILAEASPKSVLKLLESTTCTWSDQELLEFKDARQQIVWALEKIAVWTPLVTRAIRILKRFALNENANNSNNATGILVNFFSIGPESTATEASPEERFPVVLEMFRSTSNA